MRLWTLHPCYLDAKGLVALWREGLLAQKVLQGQTVGYRHHPQLIRFRDEASPLAAIAAYLEQVYQESCNRGYTFDRGKISKLDYAGKMAGKMHVNNKQLEYEFNHLKRKLQTRDPARFAELKNIDKPKAHPLFRIKRGPIASWEIL